MSDIRTPNSCRRDFTVEVSASTLRQVREGLVAISKIHFLPRELCLAGASMAGGVFLSALTTGFTFQSGLWWFFYCILPAFSLASLVGYLLLTKFSISQPSAKAQELLRIIPDPDKTSPMFEEIEKLAGSWKLESITKTSGKKVTGTINISVERGRISAAGLLYGESGDPIAEVESRICDYNPNTKHLLLIYQLSANNDNGTQVITMCVFSGIIFWTGSPKPFIKGNWFHLLEGPDGSKPWGTIKLTLENSTKCQQELD